LERSIKVIFVQLRRAMRVCLADVVPGHFGDGAAPLAQPYLVPTRDWGVVVDTAT
jgi:hypothetical protein